MHDALDVGGEGLTLLCLQIRRFAKRLSATARPGAREWAACDDRFTAGVDDGEASGAEAPRSWYLPLPMEGREGKGKPLGLKRPAHGTCRCRWRGGRRMEASGAEESCSWYLPLPMEVWEE